MTSVFLNSIRFRWRLSLRATGYLTWYQSLHVVVGAFLRHLKILEMGCIYSIYMLQSNADNEVYM